NYASGAVTSVASTGGVFTTGNLRTTTASSINVNGTIGGPLVSGPVLNGTVTANITELFGGVGHTVSIGPGSTVTPADWIAFLQVRAGSQTIVITQDTNSTSPGLGYATGGSFTVSTANTPSGNFTSLVLPTGVTANVTAPTLTYTGSAQIDGTLNTGG